MKVTFLDVKTGSRHTLTGLSATALCDGSWTCDCNRTPEVHNEDYCLGAKRYLAVKAEAEAKDEPHSYNLAELNSHYPKSLLVKHGIFKQVKLEEAIASYRRAQKDLEAATKVLDRVLDVQLKLYHNDSDELADLTYELPPGYGGLSRVFDQIHTIQAENY